MTSKPEETEGPSTRLKGEVEEQDLTFAPPTYAGPDPSAQGRWRMIGNDALIWTDDLEGAGVLWLSRPQLVEALGRHFYTAKHAGLGATAAYELAGTRAGEGAGRELTGRLQEALDDLADLMDNKD